MATIDDASQGSKLWDIVIFLPSGRACVCSPSTCKLPTGDRKFFLLHNMRDMKAMALAAANVDASSLAIAPHCSYRLSATSPQPPLM